MQSDNVIINHRFPTPINIYPISDVHLGALEHAADEWQDFCQKVEKDDKAYLIIAGDLLNNSVRGTRFANPFDEVIRPKEAKRLMAEYLKPIKHKILCVVPGNHEMRTTTEVDQDLVYDICSKLDIEEVYRRDIAYMRIGVGERLLRGKVVPESNYNFVVLHGSGGGRTGSTVNKDELFAGTIDGLDCLITGHVHKGFVTRPQKLAFTQCSPTMSAKPYLITGAVSWLTYGGYAARAMLPPAETANPQVLQLHANHHYKRITVHW